MSTFDANSPKLYNKVPVLYKRSLRTVTVAGGLGTGTVQLHTTHTSLREYFSTSIVRVTTPSDHHLLFSLRRNTFFFSPSLCALTAIIWTRRLQTITTQWATNNKAQTKLLLPPPPQKNINKQNIASIIFNDKNQKKKLI